MDTVKQEKQNINRMYFDSPEEIAIYEKKLKEQKKVVLPIAILVGITSFVISVVIITRLFQFGENLFGIIFIIVGVVLTFGVPQGIIENSGKTPKLEMLENKVNKFSDLVKSGQATSYPPIEEMFKKDYIEESVDGKIKINNVICRGIENRQFFKSKDLVSYLVNTPKKIDKQGNITYDDFDCFKLEDQISKASMKATDDFVVDSGLNDYQYVVVTRSSNKDINEGEYIFSFDKDNNLMLLKPPYVMYQNKKDETKIIYDRYEEMKPIIISNDFIKDFQLFGSQLMESSVSSDGILDKNPGLVKTVFSEFIFGTAYTIMKNLNRAGISTKHSIKDMRLVQLILNDKTDIELKGVSIYYEFNRRFGSVKNKEKTELDYNNEKAVIKEIKSSQSYIEELKELKELLDVGVITIEEFEARKKKILDFDK